MSAKETNNTSVQTTSHYWGCRELVANEIDYVGGGYDGDGDTMADFGGSASTAASEAAVAGVYALSNDTQVAGINCGAQTALASGLTVTALAVLATGPLAPGVGTLVGVTVALACTPPGQGNPGPAPSISDHPMAGYSNDFSGWGYGNGWDAA